ncbi:MAG: T9SS type A sorting domain-containing protein, partial [Prolixibacteraceae bacterium]|nr:T9SS type A sorting domain-containing protein [Prolixibacteraceae bacterium]
FSESISFAGNELINPKNKEYYHQQTFILKYDADGNEIWGRVIGENLCDVGYDIAATTEDAFFLTGTYESAQISLGDRLLKNNGNIRMLYVHLRPERESRRTFAYVALHGTVVTSHQQLRDKHQMVLYPNPASDQFTVQLTRHRGAEVSLYRHDGKLIHSFKLDENASQLVIGTEGFERGIYLVKTKMNQHVLVQKLIIQ